MKLSDYVAQFIAAQGIRHVFALSGGGSMHLIDSLAKTKGTTYICPMHEQAAAYAADGYARVSGGLGCAVATNGPGGMNLLTGIAGAWYDSLPVLFITGNLPIARQVGNTGVRQIGQSETDIVSMAKSVTKYAIMVRDPVRIRYELEKAVVIAQTPRGGPVLVDIPGDIQRAEIDPAALLGYSEQPIFETPPEGQMFACLQALMQAKRPVLIYGWGIHLARAEHEAAALAEQLNVPVVPTFAARDLVPHDHPLCVGAFGTHGTRAGNFTVQNADFILAIGTRLDTKETGTPASGFARGAKIVMVDIDGHELRKLAPLGVKLHLGIECDLRVFLRYFLMDIPSQWELPDFSAWRERVAKWKVRYPVVLPAHSEETTVNPYWFVKQLSDLCHEDDIIICDTGCTLIWTMQAFEFKAGQRFFHAFNNNPMGYGLPAAIGAAFAKPGQRIIYVASDGSLAMSVHELATVVRHNLPIKIFLLNNRGYGIVQQSQEAWLGADKAQYHATSVKGGLAFPDFVAVARVYGWAVDCAIANYQVAPKIAVALVNEGPRFLSLEIGTKHRISPLVRSGRPNEDADPLLSREELAENMIVPSP